MAYQGTDLGPTRGLNKQQAEARRFQDETDDDNKRVEQVKRDWVLGGFTKNEVKDWEPVTVHPLAPGNVAPSTVPTPPPSSPLPHQPTAAPTAQPTPVTLTIQVPATAQSAVPSISIPTITSAATTATATAPAAGTAVPPSVYSPSLNAGTIPNFVPPIPSPEIYAPAAPITSHHNTSHHNTTHSSTTHHGTTAHAEHGSIDSKTSSLLAGVLDQLTTAMRAAANAVPPFNTVVMQTTSSMQALERQIRELASSVVGGGRSSGRDQAGSATAAVNNYNITVSPNFDDRDTVNQLAAKLMPVFRAVQKQNQEQLAGAASSLLTQMSLGGGDQ